MDIETLGYKVKQHFLQNDNECTHIMLESGEGHSLIVEVEPFEYHSGIKLQKTSAGLISEALRLHFKKVKQEIRTKLCYLTHNGLDLTEVSGSSFFFSDPNGDIPKFQMGEKFMFPMVYVKRSELVPTYQTQRLRFYLESDERTSLFYEVANRSNASYLLDATGPYTLFAPSNQMLELAYGTNAETLTSNHSMIDAIVLSYFIPGVYDRDFTGDLINLAGDEVKVANGILQIPNHRVEEMQSRLEAFNGSMSIIDSDGVLTPQNHNEIKLDRNPHTIITPMDISSATYRIWKAEMSFGRLIQTKVSEEIDIIVSKLRKLKQMDQHVKVLGDRIAEIDLNENGDRGRLPKLNSEYLQHVKTAAQLAGIEIPFEVITKLIRNC